MPAMLIGTIDSTIYTPFTDLALAWGSQGQCQVKPMGFIFFPHFSSDQDEINMLMKQFKLNILRLLWSKIYQNQGNNCWFTMSKNFNVGMHLDVY